MGIAQPIVQRGMRRRRRWTDLTIGGILSFLAFLGLFPFLFALIGSFKDDSQFAHTYWLPALPLHWENYGNAWGEISIYWLNSIIVAVATTAAILTLGSVAGFVFARYEFPGRDLFFFLIIILLAVPGVVNLVPLFLLVKWLHLLDTLGALIVVYTVGNLYTTVYLLRNATRAINDEMFDAARVDGASGPQIYLRIVLPLSIPIMGTVLMTTITGVWNEYVWAFLAISDPAKRTIGTGLQYFTGEQTISYGPLFAGYILASLPLLIAFIFTSRYYVAGLQAGSVKL
ncbi:MAG: carbohydrate ABC transporter permease [Chloroflexota bacterium]